MKQNHCSIVSNLVTEFNNKFYLISYRFINNSGFGGKKTTTIRWLLALNAKNRARSLPLFPPQSGYLFFKLKIYSILKFVVIKKLS